MKKSDIKILVLAAVIILILSISACVFFVSRYSGSSGDYKVKTKIEEKKVEPAEEDEIIRILNIVSDKLRVFDVEEMHPALESIIKEEIESGMTKDEKKQIIERTVSEYFIKWKDEVIRDTLLDERGEYTDDDYDYIDERTGVATIVRFAFNFEMEFFHAD